MPIPQYLRGLVDTDLLVVTNNLFRYINAELRDHAADFVVYGEISVDIREMDNHEGYFDLDFLRGKFGILNLMKKIMV